MFHTVSLVKLEKNSPKLFEKKKNCGTKSPLTTKPCCIYNILIASALCEIGNAIF